MYMLYVCLVRVPTIFIWVPTMCSDKMKNEVRYVSYKKQTTHGKLVKFFPL